jgi:hypothetical protein
VMVRMLGTTAAPPHLSAADVLYWRNDLF